MRYAGIKKFDIENGLGVGITLFTQGCTKNCVGCHNKHTHNFSEGMEFSIETLDMICDFLKNNPNVKRLTLSGGDPLEQVDLCHMVLDRVKHLFPSLKIWIYSGFTYEFLISNNKYNTILNQCDVLVDGKFEIGKRKPNLYFKGSENQRVINVKESMKQDKIVLMKF
jgi:anaerobic ribonucleoside-triphosphate reductase activating protein